MTRDRLVAVVQLLVLLGAVVAIVQGVFYERSQNRKARQRDEK